MFFFSSRRRHTRYIGDWSSDVCSSDLVRAGETRAGEDILNVAQAADAPVQKILALAIAIEPARHGHGLARREVHRQTARSPRSEERRVGKECRARWASEHSNEESVGSR